MKKLIILISLLLFTFLIKTSNAQQLISVNEYHNMAAELKESTLLVVLPEDTATSNAVTKAVNKYWTFSKFKFINSSEVNSYNSKKEYFLFSIFGIREAGDKIPFEYSYMIKRASNKLADQNVYLTNIELPIFNQYPNVEISNYAYLMPFIVRLFQNQISTFYNSKGQKKACNEITWGSDDLRDRLKTMKIYVNKEGIDCEDNVRINLAQYDKLPADSYEFASTKEISKVLERQDNVAIYIWGHYFSVENATYITRGDFAINLLNCNFDPKKNKIIKPKK